MEREPCFEGTNDTELQVTSHVADVCVIPQNSNGLGEPTEPFPVEPGSEVSRKDLFQPKMAKLLMKSESGFQNMEIFSKNYRLEKAAEFQHQRRNSEARDKDDTMDPSELFNRDLLRQKKLFHSSDRSVSSTSTCSSVYSSQESDEVFSDDEDRSRNRRKLLRKGVIDTAQTICDVAARGHEQKGIPGAVGGVLRQIPPTVVKPLIVASEATSNLLGGMRNQIKPDARKEEYLKWRLDESQE